MNKQQLMNKMSKTPTPTTPQPNTRTETITFEEMKFWLGSAYDQQGFEKEIISLEDIMSEKLQFLLWAKNIIVEKKDAEEEEQEDIKKVLEKTRLQEIMFAVEKTLFTYGRAYLEINQLPNGDVDIRLAQPSFPNSVARLGSVKVRADIYIPFFFDKVKYYMRKIYTQEETITRVYTLDGSVYNADGLKEVKLKDFNKKLPKQLKLQGTINNKHKFIPVIELTYKPTYDYSWTETSRLAPINKLKGLQIMFNEGTKALRKELYLNRTKILMDKDLLDSATEGELSKAANEDIIGIISDSGGHDGENKTIEIMQGDPKVEQYWANLNNIISLAVSTLKLSELGEGDSSSTATGEIFNKGNDVETANALQTFRQKTLKEIITKIFAMKNNTPFNEDELDTSEYMVQLIPNVIMNEAKMTEMVSQQLSMGIINMVQAKVKLEGISPQDAKNSLSQDEEFHNPNLMAVSSFGDDEEENNDMKPTSSGNNKPKPE